MGTTKHRNLTVDTLTVTGSVSLPAGALPDPVQAERAPVAPHPLPLPEKTTMAALRDRVEYLTGVLLEAGLIHPVERPVSAPEAVEAQTPAPVAESGTQGTPQAITAGVVDGA